MAVCFTAGIAALCRGLFDQKPVKNDVKKVGLGPWIAPIMGMTYEREPSVIGTCFFTTGSHVHSRM